MPEREKTLSELTARALEMCACQGWGDENHIQNPQHVAMAMSVEMGEVLEHFAWLNPEDVVALREGRDPKRCADIAEEIADVMIYGLQLANALHIDLAHEIDRKIDIVKQRNYKN